jgi:DNA replication protein DnaC
VLQEAEGRQIGAVNRVELIHVFKAIEGDDVPEIALAHGDGTYPTLLARFARVDVLILDDWGLVSLKDTQRQDLLEILDDRDGSRSTVITSQLPSDRWHEYLGDPTMADAILDRVGRNVLSLQLLIADY